MLRKFLFATLATTVVSVGTSSSAATVSFIGDRVNGKNITSDYVFGTATCSVSCIGILSDGSLSATEAFAVNLDNANPSTEATALSDLLGLTGAARFLGSDATKVDNGTSPFNFTGLYVALKFGQMTGFLFNTAGVEQTVSYVGNPAGGLSHKTNIGELPTPVPLPAAAWLLLAALGGMFAVSRKRIV